MNYDFDDDDDDDDDDDVRRHRGVVHVLRDRCRRQLAHRKRVEPTPVRRAVQLSERGLVQARSHGAHRNRNR